MPELRISIPDGMGADAPVVVLVHGTGGTIDDMADPAVHPGFAVERVAEGTVRDRGWHPYPNVGWWSLGVDPDVPVEGWEPFLNGRRIPTVNYAQAEPNGPVAESTTELVGVIGVIAGDQRLGDRRLVLAGHSRGGVVVRSAIVELADSLPDLLARVSTCITLHAPNRGSNLANVALGLASLLREFQRRIEALPLPGWLKDAAFGKLVDILEGIRKEASLPTFRDYEVGSQTLQDLAAREPVPGIQYFTFGGTRPVLLNVRGWALLPSSAIPLPHLPPFHWDTAYQTLFPLPPSIDALPELRNGSGDVLVSDVAARLAATWSIHRSNHINHAEALWDPSIKTQVAAILEHAPLSDPLVVEFVDPDTADPDRAIDALGGASPTGRTWRLALEDALAYHGRGHALFVRRPDDTLVPLQRVRRRDGRRYFRSLPGAGGPRLVDLPRCP